MRRIAIGFTAAFALLAPATAQAHVSLHPNDVQVPPDFLDISTEYMPGWSAKA